MSLGTGMWQGFGLEKRLASCILPTALNSGRLASATLSKIGAGQNGCIVFVRCHRGALSLKNARVYQSDDTSTMYVLRMQVLWQCTCAECLVDLRLLHQRSNENKFTRGKKDLLPTTKADFILSKPHEI